MLIEGGEGLVFESLKMYFAFQSTEGDEWNELLAHLN